MPELLLHFQPINPVCSTQQLKEYFSFSSGQESGAQKKNLLLPRFHRQQLTPGPFYLKRFAPF